MSAGLKDAIVPSKDARAVVPHPRELELVETPDIGRYCSIGERPSLTGKIRPILYRRFDTVEQLPVLMNRIDHKRCLEPMRDYLAFDLGALPVRRPCQFGCQLLRRQASKPLAVRRCEGQCHAKHERVRPPA
jgi:hypothetical protein